MTDWSMMQTGREKGGLRMWSLSFYFTSHCAYLISRVKFFEIVKDTCQQQFKTSIDKLLKPLSSAASLKDDDIRSVIHI